MDNVKKRIEDKMVIQSMKQTTTEFMSLDYTTVMRGVAILMVMLQHLSGFVFGSRVFTPFGGGRSRYILDY